MNKYWNENLPVHSFVFSSETPQECTDSCRYGDNSYEGRGDDDWDDCPEGTIAEMNGQCKTCSEINKNDNFCCLENTDELCCEYDGILFDPVENNMGPYGIHSVYCSVPGCNDHEDTNLQNDYLEKFYCDGCDEDSDWPLVAIGPG